MVMDKRISSRFMSRQIYFFVPDTEDQLTSILREMMLLPTNEIHSVPSDFITRFNEAVELILVDDQIKRLLRLATANQFSIILFLRNVVSYMSSRLCTAKPMFTYELFEEAFEAFTTNDRLEFIRGIVRNLLDKCFCPFLTLPLSLSISIQISRR